MRNARTRTFAVALAGVAILAAGCQKSSPSTPAAVDAPASSSVPSVEASSAPAAPVDNGVAALTADQILQRAKAALKQAKSFRVKGGVKNGGEKITLDLEVSGKDVGGSMSIGAAKVQLLSAGGKYYMRPNEQFWVTSGAGKDAKTVAALVGDRWVKVPSDQKDLASLFDVANPDELLKPDGKLTKGKPKEISGVPAIGLVESGSDAGTLYVATTGKPYPVELAGKDGSTLAFTSIGATFTDIKAPSASQVLDLAALAGK